MSDPGAGSPVARARTEEDSSTVAGQYARRAADYATLRDEQARKSTLLSHGRAATFLILLAAGLWFERRPDLLAVALMAIAFLSFLVLLFVHDAVRRRERRYGVLTRLAEDGGNRLARRWGDLARRPAPPGADAVEGADDLDLFGRPALAQLLGPVATPQGQDALAAMLLSRDAVPSITARQQAVRELAHRVEFRDELAADGILETVPDHEAVRRFLDWAESSARGSRLPTVVMIAVPPLWIAAAWAWIAGLAPFSVIGVPLIIAILLTWVGPGRDARAELLLAFGREAAFRAYPALFARAGAASFEAPLLVSTSAELRTGPFAATRQMQVLARLAHLASLRLGMLYLPVQLITLWDSHVLRRVDAWRDRVGPHVRDWFEALGRVEALSALATLAHDHPDWPFPELTSAATFDAHALGHPMLDPQRRVDNDVAVGPPGTFLLVTGSNMSGKSTLLRAIGLNIRLAMAGAPACAKALSLPRVELRTSIHVEDSLTSGVSLFMAQLRRVKAIVDAARDAAEQGTVLVYLMDEMLAGTNTDERRIAATRVIRHLIELGAIGAVTTHDLALAAVEELRDAAVPVHFRETVHPGEEPALTFDYRLREGVATSTNALRLMEIVGLGRE